MSSGLVIDGRALQPGFKAHLKRGIGRYAKNLLSAMADEVGHAQLLILAQGNLPEPELPREWPLIKTPYAPSWLPIGKRVLSHHCLARRTLARERRLERVIHFLSHLDSPALPGPRSVLTVHDLIAQRLAHLYQADKTSLRFKAERWLETRCLSRAARIIAVSRTTADDLSELYQVPPEKIRVIPEAADPGLAPETDPARRGAVLAAQGLSPREPFFFYLGGIDQRKDLGTLLAALAALAGEGLPHTLAVAGQIENDAQYPKFLARVRELGLRDSTRLLGFVADADLPALFSSCAAFVFPSLYEGFGLPPLEAMACGAPVVAAKAAAVPEVVGEAGILTPPGDAAALARALKALLSTQGLADDLRAKGLERAKLFSWPQAARQTLEVYREVARGT